VKSVQELMSTNNNSNNNRFRVGKDGLLEKNPHFIAPPSPSSESKRKAISEGSKEQVRKRDIVDRRFYNWRAHPRLQETKGKGIEDWHDYFATVEGVEPIAFAIDSHKESGRVPGPLKKYVGIGLVGPPGCGKTAALTALLRWRRRQGDVCLFLDFNEMVRMCASGFAPKNSDAGEYRAREARGRLQASSVDTLVWDDIGRKPLSDTAEELVFNIVDRRNILDYPIFWTSNVYPEVLEMNLGDRIWSRLSSLCAVIPVDAESARPSSNNILAGP